MVMINLSFAACGFLGIYQLGAVEAFLTHGHRLLSGLRACAGASAGALVAAVLITAPDKLEVRLNTWAIRNTTAVPSVTTTIKTTSTSAAARTLWWQQGQWWHGQLSTVITATNNKHDNNNKKSRNRDNSEKDKIVTMTTTMTRIKGAEMMITETRIQSQLRVLFI